MISALQDLDVLPFLSPNLILTSSSLRVAKPIPQFFRTACERSGLHPNEILHVGDEPIDDYTGARASGLRALLLMRQSATSATSSPSFGDVIATPEETNAIQQADDREEVIGSLSEVVEYCN